MLRKEKNKDSTDGINSKKIDHSERENESGVWRKNIEVKDSRITELEGEVALLKDLLESNVDNYPSNLKSSKKNKDADGKRDGNESWKQELEAKNRRIIELEKEMASLENFLRDHSDTESIRDLELEIERKLRRIEELEETVAEFEDFLKQNPDVKELHHLRCQVSIGNRRIQELERWIEKGSNERAEIDQARVSELEEMVSHLEDYVKEHNVDGLKRKLQDRECRIDQLQVRISCLEKELLKAEEHRQGKHTPRRHRNTEERGTAMDTDLNGLIMKENQTTFEQKQQVIKMEHVISEKESRIQAYEQQMVETKDEMANLHRRLEALETELSEYDDIGVLKEEIRVRDERIQQLEDEVDSLERAFNDRIDLEQIEELVNVVKKKEEKEHQLRKDLYDQKYRIDELSEALRETIIIVSDGERRFSEEEKLKQNALDKVSKLEQRVASLQTASALKCVTCQPLVSKLQRYEIKLQQLTAERKAQLEDLQQMKREALKAAVSEKDAHLALIELSGMKTTSQAEQVEKLKVDRKKLLERLKKEDERTIELSAVSGLSDESGAPHLLAKLLDASDDDESDQSIINDKQSESGSPRPSTTNGDSCSHIENIKKTPKSGMNRGDLVAKEQDSR